MRSVCSAVNLPFLAATIAILLGYAGSAVLVASESNDQAGPFTVHHTGLDPANPQAAFVARDGTVASVTARGDAQQGDVDVQLWSGDNQMGGWGYGGINLHGPSDQAAWIGLRGDWAIRQGVDPLGAWIYYTRFAQDAVLTIGYARSSAGDLPSDSTLHLTSSQPFDRVVVSLPFRWLLGGGSAYQTGLFGGNPPSAGVWAIPAGMSLSQAQNQPDTYLLARLESLLKEVPPHRWHSRFHLDVSPDYPGGWLLSVDIAGNGAVDVRTHGDAEGHRALPFAPLSRDSGVLISARPAFGVHAGMVGRTDMRLSYEIAPAPKIPGLDDDLQAANLKPGLIAAFFDFNHALSSIPDLDPLTPDVQRIDAVVNYPSTRDPWPGLPATMADTFASRHQGYVYVPEAGEYTLAITSDDGSRLYLNGEPAIDNDGRHGMRRRSLTTHLDQGLHSIRLDFFENTGGAGLILRWQPPGADALTVIPASNLYHSDPSAVAPQATALLDRRPLDFSLPDEARSSPLLLGGRAWSAQYPVTAYATTLPGDSQLLSRLGERDVFIDLPLDPHADTLVTIVQDGQPLGTTIDASISWLPISMYHNEAIAIRVGSAIKLLASDGYPDGDIHIDANGDGTPDYIGPAYEAYVHQYTEPGIFTAIATNAAGEEIGRSVVTVGNLRLPSRIAAQVGYRRPVDVHTGAFVVTDLSLSAANPDSMEVELVEFDGPHARITVRPLARGDHTLLIHHVPSGALLHSQEIHEFTLSVPNAGDMLARANDSSGIIPVIMTPFIPDIIVDFDMFAAAGSFPGGKKSFTMNTSAIVPIDGHPPGSVEERHGEVSWVLQVQVTVVGGEYCFQMWPGELDEAVHTAAPASSAPVAEFASIMDHAASSEDAQASPSQVSLPAMRRIGPKANINGKTCYVSRLWSLLFVQADDSKENETIPLAPEFWFPGAHGPVSKAECRKANGAVIKAKDCDLKYKAMVEIGEQNTPSSMVLPIDPEPYFFSTGKPISAEQPCSHACKVFDGIHTTNRPGVYETSLALSGSDDWMPYGGFHLSMLDASGPGGATNDLFPAFAETLPRRPGTIYEPVIVIEAGGEVGALYGVGRKTSTLIDSERNIWSHTVTRDCSVPVPATNVWTFSIRARHPTQTEVNLPEGYEVRWRQSMVRNFHLPSSRIMETEPITWREWDNGGASGSSMERVRVAYGPGRHYPRAEIWQTHRWEHNGSEMVLTPLEEPQMISYAEIHALQVEVEYDSNVLPPAPLPDLPSDIRSGSPFEVTNLAGGLGVDAKLSIPGSGNVRGRVSPNGYPQNQYWGGVNDSHDLAQVIHVPHGENQEMYIQGYRRWCPTGEPARKLTLLVEGQAFIETCSSCWLFDRENHDPSQRPKPGPDTSLVEPSWQLTDTETFETESTILIDLDIDSDNNNGFDLPDRSEEEDAIEDRSDLPGKYIPINNGDENNDGVPNWAHPGAGAKFTPVIVELSAEVDLSQARLRFIYDASDPAAVASRTEKVLGKEVEIYAPGSGSLRLWTKNGDQDRDEHCLSADGDFVNANIVYEAADFGEGAVFILYLEGIALSQAMADQRIVVEIDPDGDGPTGWLCQDAVRVTVVGVDLDIDSDNDNGFEEPDRSDVEGQIEDRTDMPGKFIAVNNGDEDGDGVPNYADGFDLYGNEGEGAGGRFTPVVIELSMAVDLSQARLRFEYDASDPADVSRRTEQVHGEDVDIYTPGSGSLRLWTKNGSESRLKACVSENGHFIRSEMVYEPSDFGEDHTFILYVEGIEDSGEMADQRIVIELNPNGDDSAGWISQDAIRVTVVNIDLDIDTLNVKALEHPDRSDIEEALEDYPGHPGKALALNELDRDKDGVPDFADGYDIDFGDGSQMADNASRKFVPVILEFSMALDLNKATVRFGSHDKSSPLLSDPSQVTRAGDGIFPITYIPPGDPYRYEVTDNRRVRLWTKNGDMGRRPLLPPDGDAILEGQVIKVSDLMGAAEKVSGNERAIILYLEALRGSDDLGDVRLRAEVNPVGTGTTNEEFIAGDTVRATVFHIHSPGNDGMRPSRNDFAAGQQGKLLISARQEANPAAAYHTTALTTRSGERAQTSDAKVTVSAYIHPHPPEQYPNLMVYFEVIDPDDRSHYEGKTTPGNTDTLGDIFPNDNRDPYRQMTWNNGVPAGYVPYQNRLSVRSDRPIKAPAAGNNWVAETDLTITDRYAGDNYRARATMQNPTIPGESEPDPFDTISGMTPLSGPSGMPGSTAGGAPFVQSMVKETELLVAWKRVYIEQDNMYAEGATITAAAAAGATDLTVDSTADFTAGDDVVVFWQGGDQVVSISAVNGVTSLTIAPALANAVPRFGGIRPDPAPGVYTVDRRYLEEAFGSTPDGSTDAAGNGAGAFIEFRDAPTGSGRVPKYAVFPSDAIALAYSRYWFDNNSEREQNVLYLLAANRAHSGTLGWAWLNRVSVTIVFDGAKTSAAQRDDTVVHEVGHRFGLDTKPGTRFSHIDNHENRRSHSGRDRCVMAYGRNRTDDISEFSIPCLQVGSTNSADDSLRWVDDF